MRDIFNEDNCEAVLLVDLQNPINTINRKTMPNMEIKCPVPATYAEITLGESFDLCTYTITVALVLRY